MSRQYHIFLLNPETEIGQGILTKIKNSLRYLQVLIPAGIYNDKAVLPPNQVLFNPGNKDEIINAFKLTQVVIGCTEKSVQYEKYAKEAGCTFINAYQDLPSTIIKSAIFALNFVPDEMEATRDFSDSFLELWSLSHQPRAIPCPKLRNGKYCVYQGEVQYNSVKVQHYLAFSNIISAYCFYLFCLIIRFVLPFGFNKTAKISICNWTFKGTTTEHNKRYNFTASASFVKPNSVRSDIALSQTLDVLDIKGPSRVEWNCCSQMKIKLESYDPQ